MSDTEKVVPSKPQILLRMSLPEFIIYLSTFIIQNNGNQNFRQPAR